MSKAFQRKHKINQEIRYPYVRIVEWDSNGVLSLTEALRLAKGAHLDLVLINEKADPPIVKIVDYNKFLYQIEKAEKEKKKNSHKTELKEIRLSVNIAENDFKTMGNRSSKFLERGDQVKVTLQMKGRERDHPERGRETLQRFVQSLQDFHGNENSLRFDSGTWHVILNPKNRTK